VTGLFSTNSSERASFPASLQLPDGPDLFCQVEKKGVDESRMMDSCTFVATIARVANDWLAVGLNALLLGAIAAFAKSDTRGVPAPNKAFGPACLKWMI
jgi:hypothetical protein